MPKTVLVVDDDRAIQRLFATFLNVEGYRPAMANNGHEALTYLRGGGVADLILLDLKMPVMDGTTFRREQRTDPALAGIPVIVLSGADDTVPLDLEAAAAFRKPVRFAEVIATIRRICSSSA